MANVWRLIGVVAFLYIGVFLISAAPWPVFLTAPFISACFAVATRATGVLSLPLSLAATAFFFISPFVVAAPSIGDAIPSLWTLDDYASRAVRFAASARFSHVLFAAALVASPFLLVACIHYVLGRLWPLTSRSTRTVSGGRPSAPAGTAG
jgi:hypothetical protein